MAERGLISRINIILIRIICIINSVQVLSIGKSGDGGIDGIIKEDKLGLDIVYVQAKRWDNTVVGRPEIQKFVGALHGQRVRKGVFITTSRFSQLENMCLL